MSASAASSDLETRFARHLDGHPRLVPSGARVVVALSGGPDSMALLHLLRGAAPARDLRLTAAHYDHALREESALEARRVRGWAEEAGVPCRVAGPARRLPSDQASLREARYAFLEAVADEVGADRVATGHQADDQAETVLFRILRGTGVRGLAGIPRRRGRIVRPLLPFRRDAVEAYLEERSIPFLRDPSNRDPRWARSRIRTRVLPTLEDAWPGPVRQRLLELADAARRAEGALEREARRLLQRAVEGKGGPWGADAYRLRLPPLREAGPELRARALRILARRLDVRLTRGGTRAAVEFISRGRSGGTVDVGGGLQLAREFDHLWMGRPDDPVPDTRLEIGDPGPGSGSAWIGGRKVAVAWGPGDAGLGGPDTGGDRTGGGSPAPAGATAAPEAADGDDGAPARRLALPLERVRFPLRLRSWEDGDRIRTPAGTRKLKRVFNDRRVPLSRRGRIPVLAAPDGRVLWVAGVERDAEHIPEAGEDRLLIEIHDA